MGPGSILEQVIYQLGVISSCPSSFWGSSWHRASPCELGASSMDSDREKQDTRRVYAFEAKGQP